VKLSVDVIGTSVQFVVFRSEFCSNPKLDEGTSQERRRSVPTE
jgi:hypothetical protein